MSESKHPDPSPIDFVNLAMDYTGKVGDLYGKSEKEQKRIERQLEGHNLRQSLSRVLMSINSQTSDSDFYNALECIINALGARTRAVSEDVMRWADHFYKNFDTVRRGDIACVSLRASAIRTDLLETHGFALQKWRRWWQWRAINNDEWTQSTLARIRNAPAVHPELDYLQLNAILGEVGSRSEIAAQAALLRLVSYERQMNLSERKIKERESYSTTEKALTYLGEAAALPKASQATKDRFLRHLEQAKRLVKAGGSDNLENAHRIASALYMGTKYASWRRGPLRTQAFQVAIEADRLLQIRK